MFKQSQLVGYKEGCGVISLGENTKKKKQKNKAWRGKSVLGIKVVYAITWSLDIILKIIGGVGF